jgi:hypothetical protein
MVGMHSTLQFHKPHTLWMWYFVLLVRQGSKLIKHAWFWHKHVENIVLSILTGHLYFFDKRIILYELYKVAYFFWNFWNKNKLQKLFTPGSVWPTEADRGGPGHIGWPAWPGRLGNCPGRPAPRHRRRPAMAGATAQKKEGERGRLDWELTGNPPGRSPWPEDGRSRRISAAEELVSGEVSVTVAAIRGTSGQFLERGGRGRRRGSSHHVGGAGGSTGCRR